MQGPFARGKKGKGFNARGEIMPNMGDSTIIKLCVFSYCWRESKRESNQTKTIQ